VQFGLEDREPELWQGLTQLAVGITHVQRGNVKGAMSLLRNASTRVLGTKVVVVEMQERLTRHAYLL
jgi:predicted metal-dependent hydrolase